MNPETLKRNEAVPFDWRIVKADQTAYCEEEWLKESYVKACGVFYLYDANRHVHICSFTPSAELWPMNPYAIPTHDDLSEEENEKVGDVELELMASEEACSYTDMTDVKCLTSRPASDFVSMPEREEDEDCETYYQRCVEYAQEYLAGNPVWF